MADWLPWISLSISLLSLAVTTTVAWRGRYRPAWVTDPFTGLLVNQTGEAAENIHVQFKGGMVSSYGRDHFPYLEAGERAELNVEEGEDQGAVTTAEVQVIWTRPKDARAYILDFGSKRARKYAPEDRGFHEKRASLWKRAKEKWF